MSVHEDSLLPASIVLDKFLYASEVTPVLTIIFSSFLNAGLVKCFTE